MKTRFRNERDKILNVRKYKIENSCGKRSFFSYIEFTALL